MANNTDWLNISQMTGGTGETALSLTALTNNSLQPKTATITARNSQYNVSDTTTVTIQGFQPTLTLSRSTLRFDSTGGTATFTVYSNTAWTINFPALVHSYSTSAGTGDTEVTVVLAPNPDEVAKVDTGIVKDVFNVNQLYLTIVQESFIVELYVEPDDDIVFKNTGSTTAITIDSNADWELEYPSWVTPSITSGESGTTTVTFTAGQNGPTDRSGEITVYAGSKYVTINVFQPFYIPPYITVTPSAWTFNYTEDGKTFVVDSYPGWTGEIISTGETVWESDIYMEATFEIPSAMTMALYRYANDTIGIYNGPIRIYGDTITFDEAGTYKLRYEISSNGTTPDLSGLGYLTDIYISDGIGHIGGFPGCSSLTGIISDCVVAPSVSDSTFVGVASGGTLVYPDGSDYSSWLSYLSLEGWGKFDPSALDVEKVLSVTYEITSSTNPTIISGYSLGYYCLGMVDSYGNFIRFPQNSTSLVFSQTGKQTFDIYYKRNVLEGKKTQYPYYRVNLDGIGAVQDITFHHLPLYNNNQIMVYLAGGCRATGLTIDNTVSSSPNGPHKLDGASLSRLKYVEFCTNATEPIDYEYWKNTIETLVLKSEHIEFGYTLTHCENLTTIISYLPIAPDVHMVYTAENGVLYHPAGSDYSSWLSYLPNSWREEEL